MNTPARILALAALCLAAPAATLSAATPSSGTLSPSSLTVDYVAGPFTSVNPSPQLGDPDCSLFPGSCDDFLLTVDVDAAYLAANPDHVVTISVGWPIAQNDFDVYLQNPATETTITSSASSNNPEIIVFAPLLGQTVYRIRTLAFLTANESFEGHITLGPRPVGPGLGTATYVPSGDIFTCNTHLEGQSTVFDHGGDGEPAIRFDPDGNAWVTGIAGLGGGIGLWKIPAGDVCAQAPIFYDSPDAGVGGGDTDIEIAPERNLLGEFNIYTSSLTLANITSSTSLDGGNTFAPIVVSDPVPVNDRQWNAAYGVNTLFLSWRSLNTGNQLFCARSDDAGLTFGPPIPVYDDVVGAALSTQLGNLVIDQRPGASVPLAAGPDGEGNLYHGYILTTQDGSNGHKVYVSVSRDFGVTWTSHLVYAGPVGATFDHVFSWVAVDDAGNVFTVWADGNNVWYSGSSDIRTSTTPTWTPPVRVNNGADTRSCVLPMVDAGSAGRIVVAWYGTSAPNSSTPGSSWHYFHARCNNALDVQPLIEQVRVSDHIVHTGVVCEDGLGCSCCRDLLECQELDVSPLDGSTLLTYAGAGGVYLTRQVAGTSALDGATIVDNSGPCPTPADGCVLEPVVASRCIEPGVQLVDDPAGDVASPGDARQDLEAVWMAEPYMGDGIERLVVTMKVGDLSSLPPNTLYTVLWTNPVAGDPFPQKFVQMNTCDPLESPAFAYGHVEGTLQTQDGSLEPGAGSYTPDGTIRLMVDPALVGDPPPGFVLSGVTGEVRLLVGAACTGLITVLDSAGGFAYTREGNGYCRPHTVSCPVSGSFPTGDSVVTFEVDNPSGAARRFHVTLTDDNAWIVGGPVTLDLGPIPPNSAASVSAVLRVPADCMPSATDPMHWTAVAADLPPSVSEASCATTAMCTATLGTGEPGGRLPALRVIGANPFRSGTLIRYSLDGREPVRVEVFSVSGRLVRTLVDEIQDAGEHTVGFDLHTDSGAGLPGGVYFMKLRTPNREQTVTVVGIR